MRDVSVVGFNSKSTKREFLSSIFFLDIIYTSIHLYIHDSSLSLSLSLFSKIYLLNTMRDVSVVGFNSKSIYIRENFFEQQLAS
jgi:hypothetical protein